MASSGEGSGAAVPGLGARAAALSVLPRLQITETLRRDGNLSQLHPVRMISNNKLHNNIVMPIIIIMPTGSS